MKSIFKQHSMKPMQHHDDSCGCGHSHHDHHREGVHCSCGSQSHAHTDGEHRKHIGENRSCGQKHDQSESFGEGGEDDSGGEDNDPHGHNAYCEHEHNLDEHCGCGHDHHEHNHDEHCGCGHDHHEHGHDEHCGCGHDHHEHDHDEHCGCGHGHHEHDHEPHKRAHRIFSAADSKNTERKTYILENLGCAHCASKMEDKINQIPEVSDAVIIYATKQLRITAKDCDALLPEIRKICSDIESQVKVLPQKQTGRKAESSAKTENIQKKKKISHDTWELVGIICGALLFAGSAAADYAGMSDRLTFALSALSYIILGGSVILKAIRNIFKGQIFDENFLMSIATLGAFVISEYLEAVGVMLFYRIGEYFEHKAVERSRGQIMDAVDMRPETVTLITSEGTSVIAAEDARTGDILLIRPGDRIPLDSTVTEGESRLDTSPITGEPVPVSVKCGDSVTSGCINTSGQLKIRVEKPLSESMVTRILDSVENAAASKPKIDRFITRFSKIYTPCVVIGALLLAIIPSLITGDRSYWIYTALTFLVMSCPCALVLSVPLAFFSGIGAGSKKGILFKGGVSIEALGKLKAVVMDKTGTITEGNFELQQVISEGSFTEEELLSLAACCEYNSTHPIAVSIVNAAKASGLKISAPSSLEEIAGHGIAAEMYDGKKVLCGNRKLMEKYGIKLPSFSKQNFGAEVFIASDGLFAGRLIISDTLKSDAAEAVKRLKSMGLYTVMLTGDSKDSAEEVAEKTGIDEVHAKLLPQDKLSILTEVRSRHGSVMFVGDGINDAPVLAGADVGAAMGSGADAAIEAADAVFMNTGAVSIPDAVSIAKRTGRIAMQNVVSALAVKAVVMLLGIAGFANMWLAVFADSGVAMLCVLNSVRILYQSREKK